MLGRDSFFSDGSWLVSTKENQLAGATPLQGAGASIWNRQGSPSSPGSGRDEGFMEL